MPIQLTHRDHNTLSALQKLPLTSAQLFRLSETFNQSFPSERVLRRRMLRLKEEGMVRRFFFAFPSDGRNPAYWRLTRRAFRLINQLSGSDPLPRRSMFAAMGVSLHFHTHRLNEVVVALLVAAHRDGFHVDKLELETSLTIDIDNSAIPDATLELLASDGRKYRFFVELDTASERIATQQRLPSSIQKKLEFYERYRKKDVQPFRVLFVTTSSHRRATNILKFSNSLSHNRAAKLVIAAHLPNVLGADDCLVDKVFQNHQLQDTALVRKPRFCRLHPIFDSNERTYEDLNRKEFVPLLSRVATG